MPYQYVPPGMIAGQPGVPQYAYPPAGQLEQLRAQQYQAMAMPVQATQAQPASSGIIWVQGEAGAKSYMVAPGASVMLMDSEGDAFYIKSADAAGMPLPLRIFDYQERQAQQASPPAAQPVPEQDYATRAELAELRQKLFEIERRSVRERVSDMRKEGRIDGQPVVQTA